MAQLSSDSARSCVELDKIICQISEMLQPLSRNRAETNTELAFVCVFATLAGVEAYATQQEMPPPLIRQLFDNNWPSEEETQQLRNELFYQRAI